MQHRKLGNTGLMVPAIGLGCASFGGIGSAPAFFGQGESEPQAHAILDAGFEMGITLLDTADAYGGGRSETYIGNWLREKGARVRDGLIISTKVFNPVGDGPNDRGLSRRHVMRQVDASLQRLGCEWIDMYLIHEPDPTTPLEETLAALADVVRAGKVRYIGASNMPAWLMTKALWISDKNGWPRFDWVQNSYSLLDRADEREMMPLCADQKLGYTPFSPLAGGWLTGKYTSVKDFPTGSRMTLRPEPYMNLLNQNTLNGLQRMKAMADARNVSMAGLALAWVMAHPLVTFPIVGPRKPAHLQPVTEALALSLSEAERNEVTACFGDAR